MASVSAHGIGKSGVPAMAAWLLSASLALGQEPEVSLPERPQLAKAKDPLTVSVELPKPAVNTRSGAPVPLLWTMEWKGRGLLEGTLRYEVFEEGERLGSFVLEDLAISGVQSFRTMLPALRSPTDVDAITVKLQFVATDGTVHALPAHTIKIPLQGSRHAVLLLCDTTDVSIAPDSSNLLEALSVTQFEAQRRSLVTQSARLRPQDMPADPLHLCGNDVVAITGAAFGGLREPQIEALLRWVEAGGAVFVSPSGSLQERHVRFLNELAREDLPQAPFRRDEQGRLAGAPAGKLWLGLHRGLGRAAVNLALVPPPPDLPPKGDALQWPQVAAFVWRYRGEPIPAEFEVQERQLVSPYSVRHAPIGEALLKHLLPERVQVVPLWVLASLLAVYLLTIGPLEYWGLGLIRLRRLTWILFPITTALFTGGILWLSNRYMYSEVQSRSVTFVDVVDDGRVARQDRLELLFTNTYRQISHDVQRAYFTPLNLEAFGANLRTDNETEADLVVPVRVDSVRQLRQQEEIRRQGSAAETVEYVGRIPGRYAVRQVAPQWTPQLNRWMTLAPNSPRMDFPWESLHRESLAQESERRRIVAEAKTRFGDRVSVWIFPDRQPLIHDSGLPPELLAATCLVTTDGISARLSRLSPCGGGHLEDLAILDPEGSEALLVICIPHGNDYVVCRRLYR